MWQILRSISDAVGVGFLATQLVKLVGVMLTLFGPAQWIAGLFEGVFPFIAKFFTLNLGWDLNGLDIMAISVAISGTLIVASSVTTKEAMSTIYVFRFFMIPYALLIITFAIVVQVITPFTELATFADACSKGEQVSAFYGSSCAEMSWSDLFGGGENSEASNADDFNSGTGFILAAIYLVGILPLIAVIVFFFKRLSVNRLLRRVVIAVSAALAIVAFSTGVALVTGEITMAELGEQWFG